MKDDIKTLFDASETMNGSVLSLTRSLILFMLTYYREGLQFRELKTALRVSDGKLGSNLIKLELFGYLEKRAIQFDNKKLTIYMLTPEGQIEVNKMGEWMESMINIKNRGFVN